MKQRIDWLDNLRAFAIVLVTVGHVLSGLGYNQSIARAFIYSFHMPLFFAISGYALACSLLNLRAREELLLLPRAWKCFCRVLVPYVVCGYFSVILFGRTINQDSFAHMTRRIFIENTGFWFLPCLFGLTIIHLIVWKFLMGRSRAAKLIMFCFVQLLLIVLNSWTQNPFVKSVMSYYIPFIIGAMIEETGILLKTKCWRKCALLISILTFVIFSSGFTYFSLTNGGDACAVCRLFRMLAGIASIYVFISLFKQIKLPGTVQSAVSLIGRNTLAIYVFGIPLIRYQTIASYIPPVQWLKIPFVGLVSLFIILQALCIQWLLTRNRTIARLFGMTAIK